MEMREMTKDKCITWKRSTSFNGRQSLTELEMIRSTTGVGELTCQSRGVIPILRN
jgi:hypothetical protein